ncbi:NPC intracellular cholesterol transporter 1 [Halocaridina rubra]|uniref:NPC intracellular cholesterol transporter 1 n=1 Tax=Halocaridina rubra TaxID=373956 RepID=A0AAN8XQQ8_HALRR
MSTVFTVTFQSYGPIDSGEPGCMEKTGANIDGWIERVFTAWGTTCAENPWKVLIVGVLFAIAFSLGIMYLKVTIDPVKLWASPNSRARLEKEYYDKNFGPFYRTEMIIIRPVAIDKVPHQTPNGEEVWGPVYNQTFLTEVLKLQNYITQELSATSPNNAEEIFLEDICYSPLSPANKNCTIQSILNYFQNDEANLNMTSPGLANLTNNYIDHLASCFRFVRFMKNFTHPMMDIAFSSENSIKDELERMSNGDVKTIIISYSIMFIYIAIALGEYRSCGRLLIDSKITLGLGGVVIVLVSVSASVGIYGYAGVEATLIIFEVIPFLVLAVGVDNMFIIVQTYQRESRGLETQSEDIGRIVGRVAPTILLASCSEIACFFLGALSDMPAVRAFALYAGLSLLLDLILQLTVFVALLALDARRQEHIMKDCTMHNHICQQHNVHFLEDEMWKPFIPKEIRGIFESNRIDILCCMQGSKTKEESGSKSLLHKFFKKAYAPVLLSPVCRPLVILAFFGWLCASISVLPKIEVGLEQELSMPKDSYMLKYFQYLQEYLSVGPPVYFVLPGGTDFQNLSQQNDICGTVDCNTDSLSTQIYFASVLANRSYIAQPASSWLDDYMDWSMYNGDGGFPCCRVKVDDGSFCNSSDWISNCISCNITVLPNAIQASYFMTYHTILKSSEDYYSALKWARKVSDNITKTISKADKAIKVFPYSVFYVFYEQYLTMWKDVGYSLAVSLATVSAVSFVLSGLERVSTLIVVLTILMILVNLGGLMYWWNVSLNAVSLVNLVMVSIYAVYLLNLVVVNIYAVSLINVVMVGIDCYSLVNLVMVSIYSVFLSNLVMAVGISVEFCSHITHAFSTSMKNTRLRRSHDALVRIGSSVSENNTVLMNAWVYASYVIRI